MGTWDTSLYGGDLPLYIKGTSLENRGGPTKWAAPRLELNILAMIQLLRQKKEWSGVAKSQLAAIKDHGTILKQVSLGILI